ncbi:hypothetical protein AXF42_Ash008876 [Apostasia shenzhenica]|uniref:Uncharacterized protein n=1 Tax=Apostasia shenzhenica TaxID=1088818 RepID=A0A2I0ASR2_9ASPA|nr:hypothetical protein AXF42_Ash008876 [Apostasia shenzhenica]
MYDTDTGDRQSQVDKRATIRERSMNGQKYRSMLFMQWIDGLIVEFCTPVIYRFYRTIRFESHLRTTHGGMLQAIS